MYATPAVREVSVRLAEVAARGLIQLGTLPGGAPVSWQLIRGGAVADPDVRSNACSAVTETESTASASGVLACKTGRS